MWEVPVGRGRDHQWGGLAGALASDWTVAGIVTVQSGIPIAVDADHEFNAFAGFGAQRPNRGVTRTPVRRAHAARWFNTAAFRGRRSSRSAVPRAIRCVARPIGTSTSPSRGGRGWSWSRQANIDMHVEMFNLLNTANFGAPAAVSGAADFGSVATALDPRVVQFAGKLLF